MAMVIEIGHQILLLDCFSLSIKVMSNKFKREIFTLLNFISELTNLLFIRTPDYQTTAVLEIMGGFD